ncbi:uncharacterized protein LOC130690390 [Daphnia carinata]|uniref:uncharacterized protein LOC130690390 n=1 Tax=Daphnia carinata TaxID=120202 RepID=UPI00257DD3BD|nr:uncharacterized protein LOC130690390 [Daphnia carinata]
MKCAVVLFYVYSHLIGVSSTPVPSETKNNVINSNNSVSNNNNSALITDNLSSLHRSQQQQSEQDNSEWEVLYDKEIGTWCQPSDDDVQTVGQPITYSPLELVNRELQRMSPVVNTGPAAPIPDASVLTRWVDAALRIVRGQTLQFNCNSTDAMCSRPTEDQHEEKEEEQQSTIANSRPVASNMNLYVATVDKQQQKWNHKLDAVLPDGALTKTGAHDAWIVLDPTPHLAFGHTLYVFVVDYNTSDVNCIAAGGIPLDGDECMNRIFKNRCANRMMVRRATNAAAPTTNWRHPHRCDVDFLPLVHLQNKAPLQSEQRLVCTNQVKGLAPCPQLRSWNETSELICDPLSTNHKRCDSTQDVVKTRCRLFETCDQAVLLSGGWNWQWSGERELGRLMSVYRMLRHNGFDKQSVKIFFANGARAKKGASGAEQQPSKAADPIASDPFSFFSPKVLPNQKTADVKPVNPHRHHDHHDASERPAMYPASLKIGLRNHIRTVCTTPHCADSFVIYLSSPTRSDGASLLWDADNNGEYDETKVYTIREFLRDIQDCLARQVVVLVDQNYSGLLADSLKRSKRHANVLMFTSGQSQQLSMVGEFTHHWANYHHGHSCLSQAFKDSLDVIRFSTSRYEDNSNGTLKYNLFGAPCDAVPPYSSYELKSLYMGCQYVPTRLWLSRPGTQVDPPPRLLTGRRRR